jgi:serine/threonine-protein kinase
VPVAGSLVTANSVVRLLISSGPCTVYVANVVGDTESAATNALQGQGLQPNYTTDPTAICQPGAPQTVATQSPAAGAPTPYGSTVNMTVCQTTVTTTPS